MVEALTIEKVYKGTWKEMLVRRDEIPENYQVEVRVLIPQREDEEAEDNLFDAPIEEWEKALDDIAAMNAGRPIPSLESLRRENLYDERI